MAYKQPDQNGFYGRFGGRFVPETLMTAVLELEEASTTQGLIKLIMP